MGLMLNQARSATQGEVLRVAALQPLRFGVQSWLVEPDRPMEPAMRSNSTLIWSP